MQIKHTFLFTLILGLAWTGILFAFSTGPDPAMNGVFGDTRACSVPGCHSGNPVNATGGSVTLAGLPSQWTPNQTYPLTITVQRTGQSRFGFQLSAVFDSNTQQAGTLAPGNTRVKVIAGSGIQFAEHNNATNINTFNVNWTAPSSGGTVRFNLAGNAANGDFNSTGDFIYTRVDKVDSAAALDLSTRAFSIVDRGGMSVITDGGGGLAVGYSRIQPASGSTTPTGVAIFGYSPAGVLVSETGVPASPLITSGRIYAEINGPVRTGIAIANPNGATANISFHFTNSLGVDFGTSSTTIAANSQTAKFLDEAPFSGGSAVQGTFSFSSDVPVSVIALRLFASERNNGDSLLTTLPVTDLSAPAPGGIVYLPHFAEGTDGFKTQVILVNPTDSTITGTIQFYSEGSAGASATPISMTANGQVSTTFSYSIPRQTSFKLTTAGLIPGTAVGSVRVSASTGAVPVALAVFSFKPGAVTLAEAGVRGVSGTALRIYAEENTAGSGPGTIQTGFALANPSAASISATLTLTNLDGTTAAGGSATILIPGNGHVAKLLHEVFPTVSLPFKGILRVSGGGAEGISAVSLRLRYNERNELLITTTPPSNENGTASSAELLFPHLVNGGGFTTQFILFSGTAGQAPAGNLKFLRNDGTALNLTLN